MSLDTDLCTLRWHISPRVGRWLGFLAAEAEFQARVHLLGPFRLKALHAGHSVQTTWGRAASEGGLGPTTLVLLTLLTGSIMPRDELKTRAQSVWSQCPFWASLLCETRTGRQTYHEHCVSLQSAGSASLRGMWGGLHEFIESMWDVGGEKRMKGTTPEIKDPSAENRAHEGFLGTPSLLLQQNKYLFNAPSVYKAPSMS